MTPVDVIVVGGGPAGSHTAWRLARAGLRVELLDRARFPRAKPCGEYLSPEASRLLDEMGVLEECIAAGAAQLAGMVIRAPDGTRFRGDFAGAHAFRGYRDRGLALRRDRLDSILLDRARAAGVAVREGVHATDILRDARGVVCGVRTLEPAGGSRYRRAAFVVGADGLRSMVARRIGVAHRAGTPARIAFVSHFAGVDSLGEHGEMHVDREGYLGIAPVDAGLANVAVVVPVRAARAAAGDAAGYVDRWIAARPHLAARFTHARRCSPVLATGPFASRVRRAWTRGAALVGDAADFFDPFTGEGIYAALRGGELLAPALLAAAGAPHERAAERALAGYDAARRREFSGKWAVERLVALAVGCPPLMNRAAAVLAARADMADLLVGVAGDFVPPRAVLNARYLLRLLAGAPRGGAAARPTPPLLDRP